MEQFLFYPTEAIRVLEKKTDTQTKTVSRRKNISVEKEIGAFYTPLILAKHIVNELETIYKSQEKINSRSLKILEPAVGDGVFLNSIKSSKWISNSNITIIDIDEKALENAKRVFADDAYRKWSINAHHSDFFNWKKKHTSGSYDLVIGNPPWGKKRINDSGYSERALDFIFPCLKLLNSKGCLAFVLPGIWLTGGEHESFRTKLFSLGRDIRITRLIGEWFEDATFTVDSVVLYIGKPCKKPSLEFSSLQKEGMSFIDLYKVEQSIIIDNLEKKIPYVGGGMMRFTSTTNKPNGVKTCKSRGIIAYAGLKTGKNSKFIFNEKQAEKLVVEERAIHMQIVENSHKSNGIDQNGLFVLIPYGKGRMTFVDNVSTMFSTPEKTYVRWDSEAVSEYLENNGMRNKNFYWSTEGVNFSGSGRNCPVFRLSTTPVFDADYPYIPCSTRRESLRLLALLASPTSLYISKNFINPSAHFKNQDLANLPIPCPELVSDAAVEIVESIVLEKKKNNQLFRQKMQSLHHETSCMWELTVEESEEVWSWYSTRYNRES